MKTKYKKYTKEEIIEASSPFSSLEEFENNNSPMYWAAYNYDVIDVIRKRMEADKRAVQIEILKTSASKFKTKKEFRIACPSDHKLAHRLGVTKEVCAHMRPLKQSWTTKLLTEEALKYASRKEFELNNSNAYHAAHKKGLLDEICAHMKPTRVDWNIDLIKIEACKYETVGDFIKNDPNCYQAAWKRGVLEEVCAHMSMFGTISASEINLFDTIKALYPAARKLRDRGVTIEGKPHIKGFDLDIYIHEMGVGVEFDGKYWHSFEGLRRGRSHWPEEDVRNYHDIKDKWFLSKNVEIIHIREEDWNKDQQSCLDRCFSFLRGEDVKKTA